jgi:hypothetical protein
LDQTSNSEIVKKEVSEAIAKGYTDEQIVQALQSSGVGPNVIKDYISLGHSEEAAIVQFVEQARMQKYTRQQIEIALQQHGTTQKLIDRVLGPKKKPVPFYRKPWVFWLGIVIVILGIVLAIPNFVDIEEILSVATGTDDGDIGVSETEEGSSSSSTTSSSDDDESSSSSAGGEVNCGDGECAIGESCVFDCGGCKKDSECESYGDYECSSGAECVKARSSSGGGSSGGSSGDSSDGGSGGSSGSSDTVAGVEETECELDSDCDEGYVCDSDLMCQVSLCNDGFDNDGDYTYDYYGACDEDSDGTVDIMCGDDQDCMNDCENSGAYYSGDKECVSLNDNSELATCSDLIDNDDNGYIDYTGGCDATGDNEIDYTCGCYDLKKSQFKSYGDVNTTCANQLQYLCVDSDKVIIESVKQIVDEESNKTVNETVFDTCEDLGGIWFGMDDQCVDLSSHSEGTPDLSITAVEQVSLNFKGMTTRFVVTGENLYLGTVPEAYVNVSVDIDGEEKNCIKSNKLFAYESAEYACSFDFVKKEYGDTLEIELTAVIDPENLEEELSEENNEWTESYSFTYCNDDSYCSEGSECLQDEKVCSVVDQGSAASVSYGDTCTSNSQCSGESECVKGVCSPCWDIQPIISTLGEIDSNPYLMSRINSEDVPQILFDGIQASKSYLSYIDYASTSWDTEIVFVDDNYTKVRLVDFVVDQNDDLHVAYGDREGYLVYARYDSNSKTWENYEVDSIYPQEGVSIVENGEAVYIYYGFEESLDHYNLKEAMLSDIDGDGVLNPANEWTITESIVDTQMNIYSFDANVNAEGIIYVALTGEQDYLYSYENGEWNSEENDFGIYHNTLLFDSLGNPVVLGGAYTLDYSYIDPDTDEWVSETIDADGGVGKMVIDSGLVHASYRYGDNDDIGYAIKNTDKEWNTFSLGDMEGEQNYHDIAVDSNGMVSIFYIDEYESSVMVARNSCPLVEESQCSETEQTNCGPYTCNDQNICQSYCDEEDEVYCQEGYNCVMEMCLEETDSFGQSCETQEECGEGYNCNSEANICVQDCSSSECLTGFSCTESFECYPSTCATTDSANKFIKGSDYGVTGNGNLDERTDWCRSNDDGTTTLVEYFCAYGKRSTYSTITCEDLGQGFACQDGACLKVVDCSENGDTDCVKTGYLCASSTSTCEASCEDDLDEATTECQEGYTCYLEECVETTCEDDCGSYACDEDSHVCETTCSTNDECKKGATCLDSLCYSCTDSDDKDIYTKGIASGSDGTVYQEEVEDYCTDDTVTEYYCKKSEGVFYLSTKDTTCAGGCEDGECVSQDAPYSEVVACDTASDCTDTENAVCVSGLCYSAPCGDGLDNDGDTFIDFEQDGTGDPDCESLTGLSESSNRGDAKYGAASIDGREPWFISQLFNQLALLFLQMFT